MKAWSAASLIDWSQPGGDAILRQLLVILLPDRWVFALERDHVRPLVGVLTLRGRRRIVGASVAVTDAAAAEGQHLVLSLAAVEVVMKLVQLGGDHGIRA